MARKHSSTNFENFQHILSDCPFSRTLNALGNRWRAVIMWKVLAGIHRFGSLRRAIPPITEKMLAQELRALEAQGLIVRQVVSERPPHVAYHATPLGEGLRPILELMFAWGQQAGAAPALADEGTTEVATAS